MIDKNDLVILKGNDSLIAGNDEFSPNKHYRCSKLDNNSFIVYGVPMTKNQLNQYFELSYERILRDFKALKLIDDSDRPVSKTKFIKMADIHQYGKNLKTWYFICRRELIYGFYPIIGTKVENGNENYEMFLDIINGNLDSIDCKDVQFGNCGIPISYGDLKISNY